MIIRENIFPTIRTGRYFTNEINSDPVKNVVVLLHGYAQLAEVFIKEFSFLDNKNNLLIAPEGLSRFYKGNKIGASWMTKEFRENEISDYINYIQNILKSVVNEYQLQNIEITVIGFSQGVHTAARFSVLSDIHVNRLILCSSAFPEDIKEQSLKQKLIGTKIIFTAGEKDKIVPHTKIEYSCEYLNTMGLTARTIIFNGGHEINSQSILEAFDQ